MRRSIGRIAPECGLVRGFADLSTPRTLGLRAGVPFVRDGGRSIGETRRESVFVRCLADLSVIPGHEGAVRARAEHATDRYIGETPPGKRLGCEMADLSVNAR